MTDQEESRKIREESESAAKDFDPGIESRRSFLKVSVAASAILAVGGIAAVAKSVTEGAAVSNISNSASTTFPRYKITSVSSLQVNQPIYFNYPLDDEPNILVMLGQTAEGGVGPNNTIVAFSQLCQHFGCPYSFVAPDESPSCNHSLKVSSAVGYCCCHGSEYDFLNSAKVIGGPAPRPVPQVVLDVDSSGNVYAVGMNPPTIFGHNTGSSDVTNDLQDGNLVG